MDTVVGMTTIDELGRRLDRVEAELALHRLAHRYCIGADHRDLEVWRSVWTPDAIWDTGGGPDHVFTGVDAICGAVRVQWTAFPVMQHGTSNHVVEVDGDRATGRADVVVMVQLGARIVDDAGRWIVGGETYLDDYVRDAGIWRIARRRVERAFDLDPLADSSGHPTMADG